MKKHRFSRISKETIFNVVQYALNKNEYYVIFQSSDRYKAYDFLDSIRVQHPSIFYGIIAKSYSVTAIF